MGSITFTAHFERLRPPLPDEFAQVGMVKRVAFPPAKSAPQRRPAKPIAVTLRTAERS